MGDIHSFLDSLEIDRPVIVGHSFGGIEACHFARRYPQRVNAIVYLDALYPQLDPEPNLSGDPIWDVIPTEGPMEDDLISLQTYLDYYKRCRPDWERIWCRAIELNLLERIKIKDGGRIEFHHDDALMNRILESIFPPYPVYGKVDVSQLAIVPDGNEHPSVPLNASEQLRREADKFWQEKLLPWIQLRTEVFRRSNPTASIIEFDTPFHHIFISKEDEAVKAIKAFVQESLGERP